MTGEFPAQRASNVEKFHLMTSSWNFAGGGGGSGLTYEDI